MSEKEDDPDWWQCPSCGEWFHDRLHDMRRRSGVTLPNGWPFVCEDCHREMGLH